MPDLGTLVSNAERYMLEHGYARGTIEHYRQGWRKLAACCEELGVEGFDEESERRAIHELGLDRKGLGATQRTLLRSIRCLLSIEDKGRMPARLPSNPETVPSEALQAVVSEYLDARLARGISPRTATSERSVLNRFLASLGDDGEIGGLSPQDVTRFMGQTEDMGAQTRSSMLFTIRSFARWATEEGLCSPSVAASIPTIPAHKGEGLPSTYDPDEVAACIRSVAEGTECPKRDRAVVLLGSVLAMRAGDIRALRLGDIGWRDGKLSFVQRKTGGAVTLPLPEEVTLALADYIRNERPDTGDDHVFLHARAPYLAFDATDDSFWRIPSKGFADAGVDTAGRHHGMHSLRHSAATCMLGAEMPYPTISAVLGHASTNTTMRYMSVDVASLRRLSLEVPHA